MKRDVTRKQFLHLSLGATAAAILLPACGGDDSGDTGAGTDASTGGTNPTTGSTVSNTTDPSTDPTTTDPTVDPSTTDPTVDPTTGPGTTESTGAVDTTEGETGTTGGGACTSDPTVEIGSNHAMGPHTMTVSLAEVEAGVEVQYNIMGASGHPHTVVLTAEDFATLQQTGSVMVQSSTDAMHSHAITVTCA